MTLFTTHSSLLSHLYSHFSPLPSRTELHLNHLAENSAFGILPQSKVITPDGSFSYFMYFAEPFIEGHQCKQILVGIHNVYTNHGNMHVFGDIPFFHICNQECNEH